MSKQKLIMRAPLMTASGYGVHSRQIFNALYNSNKFDISVIPINWGTTSFIHDEFKNSSIIKELSIKFEKEKASNQTNYDISIQVTIPNEFQKLARINIGVTAGIEVSSVSPEWIKKVNEEIDLLIVPSYHSKRIFELTQFKDDNGNVLALNKQAHVVTEGVDTEIFNTKEDKLKLFDFDAKFNFLTVGIGFDKSIGEDRKDILSLVKWFCERFAGEKDVGLVIKGNLANYSLLDYNASINKIEQVKKLSGCGDFPKIHLIHDRLTDKELASLYKNEKVKAYISLTHGEGFGLPVLESAACGLPIIITDWSGHLDFLHINGKRKFVPLEFEMKAIPDSALWPGVIEKGVGWAYTDEIDVKLKMKKVMLSYKTPKKWADELAKHINTHYSLEKSNSAFMTIIDMFLDAFNKIKPKSEADFIKNIKANFASDNKTLLYTMPMSAGDVYISTAIIDSLKKKFENHNIYFATNEKYMSILKDNKNIKHVINFEDWMTNIPICEKIFDEVYTPNLSIQMLYSNWVHGGKGRLLGNEIASQCHVSFGEYFIQREEVKSLPEKYIVFHPGSGKNQHSARNYLHWNSVVSNVKKRFPNIQILQVGTVDEFHYKQCENFLGKTENFNQLAFVVENSLMTFGIDSVVMHLAAGMNIPHVSIFGSSYSTTTGPIHKSNNPLSLLLETKNRYTCDKACYKDVCEVDNDYPCINNINSEVITEAITLSLQIKNSDDYNEVEYKEVIPTLTGYTHVLNAEIHKYPYIESIKSMLGFCDNVIVVDGGSTDETVKNIKAINSTKIKIIERKWDWENPAQDGSQKAYARAMCGDADFLWQQDVDEIIHEDDYNKIRELLIKFPKDCNLIHLPIIELWGDATSVRVDRHSWKWRLSRNDFRITHGIAKHARLFDDKTGKLYAKKGQSDGCEYVDIMTGECIQHRGFYTQELENIRQVNQEEYGNQMNNTFEQLPSVFHYSWANIPRKIRNFKQFWTKCWNNLYRDAEPEDRFSMIKDENDIKNIKKVAKMLKKQGGEHISAQTFQLKRSNPKIMEKWIKKIEC